MDTKHILEQVRDGAVGDPLDEAPLDAGQRSLRDEQLRVRAAQEPVDDRVNDQRAHFEAELPFERRGVQ